MPVSFDALPLHDAPVDSVHIDWKTKTCAIALHVFLTPGVRAIPHRLHFFDVRSLSLPHEEPWGHLSMSMKPHIATEFSEFKCSLEIRLKLSLPASPSMLSNSTSARGSGAEKLPITTGRRGSNAAGTDAMRQMKHCCRCNQA
jgi:hypothetical protein